LVSRCPLTASRTCVGTLAVGLLLGVCFRVPSTGSPLAQNPPQGSPTTTPQTNQSPAIVSGVKIKTHNAKETDVDISTSSAVTYHVLELKDPPRLVLDIEGALKTTSRTSYSANSQFLMRVRLSQFQEEPPAIVRVVADLKGNPAYEVHPIAGGIRVTFKAWGATQSATNASSNQTVGTPVGPVAQPTLASPAQGNPIPVTPQPVQTTPVQTTSVQTLPPPHTAFFQKLPFNTLTQSEKLLDSLGLRIVMSFNYKKGGPNDAAWKTQSAPGVEASQVFIKPIAPSNYQTLELGLSPSAQGGFDLAVFGVQKNQAAEGPNPDFPAIQQMINEEVAKMSQTQPLPDVQNLAYVTYYLSYVVADHALAILKTLNYTTVEYSAQPGESNVQNIYNKIQLGTGKPPIIVKMIDASKTSLMDNPPPTPGQVMQGQPMQVQQQQGGAGAGYSGVPPIGGTYLHQMTSGEPQERLLILYDKNNPQDLQALLDLLQQTIDVPSRQVLIDTLVIELNNSKETDLGITFSEGQSKFGTTSVDTDSTTGAATPFTFTFNNAPSLTTFKAQLNALLATHAAEILSNPSVLVLDDRQARIQIGQQVPVTKQLLNGLISQQSVDYFPVGIVLNLRPRISQDGNDVTMQTETIISSIDQVSQKALGTSTLVAPVIDNREVQSIVRVADNTPFIIGGLISTNNTTQMNGIPLLSQIPFFGALFRNSVTTKQKQEVIVVVTPHVIPLEQKYFSYVLPKDSDQFDRKNYGLFRNAYRVRGRDLYDLSFVYESNVYKDLKKHVAAAVAANPDLKKSDTYKSIMNDGVPGEDIFVRRMLWEIIDKEHYARYVNLDKIVFIENDPSAPGGNKFVFLKDKLGTRKSKEINDLAISFEAKPMGTEDRPFVLPKAALSNPDVTVQSYSQMLANGNDRNADGTPKDWMVLLTAKCDSNPSACGIRRSPLEFLQGVLVLKHLLQLNETMPLTLKEFHIGRQIIFPTQEELQQSNLFIDRETARLFYEVFAYYPAFEQEFNRQASQINKNLGVAITYQH
jgi:hypothetical protein